jgi:hypothetical protein
MQLLIVHHDAETGGQLVQMVRDYAAHDCDLVGSSDAAINWGRCHSHCALLLTQVEDDGIDGLVLGGSLSEVFPGLQTLFLPAYPASEQRLEVADTKVFPEPIDGEGLLAAISRAQTREGLLAALARTQAASADAPDLFHVVDVLQMCCLSRRGGAVQIVKGKQSGIVFLRDGAIVHAETAAARGKEALFEIIAWKFVEFAYDRAFPRQVETITIPWDEALIEAVTQDKQQKVAQAPGQRA